MVRTSAQLCPGKCSLFIWSSQRVNDDWRRNSISYGAGHPRVFGLQRCDLEITSFSKFNTCDCTERLLHERQVACCSLLACWSSSPAHTVSTQSALNYTDIWGSLLIHRDTLKSLITGSCPGTVLGSFANHCCAYAPACCTGATRYNICSHSRVASNQPVYVFFSASE